MKNTKNDIVQDCIDLSDAMETQACGIIALGELLIAVDPERIDGDTIRGLGHLLTIAAAAMFDESEWGSKSARKITSTARNINKHKKG